MTTVHAQAATEGSSPGFDVWEIRVSGNSMLDRRLVERAVYPYLGPARGIADVEAARKALETLYRDQGFPTVIVNIPEQDVSEGIVKLEVVQGWVNRMRISGSTYFSLGRIRKSVPALAEGEVPYLPRVQEQLQALNQESSDRRITPVFRPGRRPGTVEVELRVKDELPLHGSVELNGRNSADTSRTRASANLRYDNLWQRMHSLSLQYQTSPQEPDEVAVLAATYVLPVRDGRDRLALYAINSESDTELGGTGDLSVIGNGTILGMRWVRPLAASDDYSHSLTLGADYKDFDEAIELVGADSLQTPIDYTRLSADYRASLFGDQHMSSFSVGVNFGVRGLGNSEAEFEDKRFQARPNFAYHPG
ncbi:ShlB/FhaC/HecB family hemolysin secretion/activation protein [Thiohalobacter thiocyanaticus]|nr:POTRA domain-containing protein [Thiohalobacter thiocyanaticus]